MGATPTQADLDAIYAEGKKRFEEKVPPGFADEKKEKSERPYHHSSGLRLERKFGDLVAWKQLIAEAHQKELASVIWVTDDEKPDWWLVVDSQGKKTIGPRPALFEEIRRDGGV